MIPAIAVRIQPIAPCPPSANLPAGSRPPPLASLLLDLAAMNLRHATLAALVPLFTACASTGSPAHGTGSSTSAGSGGESGAGGATSSSGSSGGAGTTTSSSSGTTTSSSSGTTTSSSSGTTTSSSSGTTTSSSSSSSSSSSGSTGLFANCSLAGGCVADCSPPANDPIATGNAAYDLYDGCILAAMPLAGMTDPWMGQILKAQMMNESGITPSVEASTSSNACGGQNCGIWAISAGSVSGDAPPGPCGSSSKDPATGAVDYSHSYGLFQSTPACEGVFLTPTLPAGVTCTGTTEANDIPFALGVDRFYCESATSLGFTDDLEGNKAKGYINAWQTTTSPLYATSIFNPAYQIYVYMDYTWKYNFADANSVATGCSIYQQWYLSLAYWLNGAPANTSCKLSGQRPAVRPERGQQLRDDVRQGLAVSRALTGGFIVKLGPFQPMPMR